MWKNIALGGAILFVVLIVNSWWIARLVVDEFAGVKTAVAGELTDPESARFRNIKKGLDDFGYCGEVNGKNTYGGYVGFQIFFARKSSSGNWQVSIMGQMADIYCKKV